MKDRRKNTKVMPTEYMLGLLVKERERQMDCEHKEFYEDLDNTFRCTYCNAIVDPDELEWSHESTFIEDPDNE